MADPRITRMMNKVRSDIQRADCSVISVLETAPPVTYTIGLYERFQHPEIIVLGLAMQTAHTLSNLVRDQLRAGMRYEAGAEIPAETLANMGFRLGAVAPEMAERICVQAGNYYGTMPPYLQLIWPDRAGLFPGDPGFEQKFAHVQPLLSVVSPLNPALS